MIDRAGASFGSSGRLADNAIRAAVAPLLTDLRSELLVMPCEESVAYQLEMMAFEQQILATPRVVERGHSRLVRPRPKRVAFMIVGVCATVASCGLSAAGALPAPLQHVTDSIARTLGVPRQRAAHTTALGNTPAPSAPSSVQPVAIRTVTSGGAAAQLAVTRNARPVVLPTRHGSTHKKSGPRVRPVMVRPRIPKKRITSKNSAPPPTNKHRAPRSNKRPASSR